MGSTLIRMCIPPKEFAPTNSNTILLLEISKLTPVGSKFINQLIGGEPKIGWKVGGGGELF